VQDRRVGGQTERLLVVIPEPDYWLGPRCRIVPIAAGVPPENIDRLIRQRAGKRLFEANETIIDEPVDLFLAEHVSSLQGFLEGMLRLDSSVAAALVEGMGALAGDSRSDSHRGAPGLAGPPLSRAQ